MTVSLRYSELQTRKEGSTLGWLQFTEGHDYVKTVGGVMVIVLCTLSDIALKLYKYCENTSKAFRVTEWIRFAH